MTPPTSVADSLLVHATFVQRLARSLAGPDGDDLAQETFAAALRGRADGVGNPRGLLVTIARNLWRNRRRDDARRAARERDAGSDAVADAAPSVDVIVQREEVRQRVVAAVLALPERLRAVVLLRFFEGLDAAAIGRRLSLPPSTVRSQLQQALERLRRQLDAEHGDRAAWSAPLAALGRRAGGGGRSWWWWVRIAWPVRLGTGAIAAGLLAWLLSPLWTSAAAPLPPPVGTGMPLAAQRGDERAGTEVERQLLAAGTAEVAPVEDLGPEAFWGRVVVAATEAGVAGAEVTLLRRDADEMNCLDPSYCRAVETVDVVRTDGDGRFRFPVQRALQYRLVVRAAGFATTRLSHCTGGSEQIIRLDRGAVVEGHVLAADGAPMADVLVEARVRGTSGNDCESTRTASDGSFFLGALEARPTFVTAEPPGVLAPGWSLVHLMAGAVEHVELVARTGRAVRGVVRDAATRKPVAGAAVADGWHMDGAATTAADGSYRLMVGSDAVLHVRARGYAQLAWPVEASADGDTECDLELERGEMISGRIVDGDGQAISNGYVAAVADHFVRRNGYRDQFWHSGTVDSGGRFAVGGLAREAVAEAIVNGESVIVRRLLQWQLLVRAPGHGARVVRLPLRQLRPGDWDCGDIVLPVQALLEGRVVDAEGLPVAGARIDAKTIPDGFEELDGSRAGRAGPLWHLTQRTTTTAADGWFRLAGLSPGSCGLSVQPDGRNWTVDSGPHAVAAGAIVRVDDIVVDRGLGIRGRVVVPSAVHWPQSRMRIVAERPGGERNSVEVGAAGAFAIDRLEPGDYRLFAWDCPAGYALRPHAGVAAGTDDLELRLVAAEPIVGRVVDGAGQPVARAWVCFWREGIDTAENAATAADGSFALSVAPGEVGAVQAIDRNDRGRQVRIERVAAGTRDLVLTLPD